MKTLKLILIFVFSAYLINPAYASEILDIKQNFNGADFWQESQKTKTILDGHEIRNTFPEKNWWLKFNDPLLTDYIEQTIRENRDIKTALSHIEEARATARYTMGSEFPQVTVYPSYFRLKNSAVSKTSGPASAASSKPASNIFLVPVVAQYELDLFLKNHDKTKSSKKEAVATEFDEQTVQISLISETATAYFNLIKSDKLLELNKQLLCELEKSRELKNSLFKEGEISYDDILINEQAIAKTQADTAQLQKLQETAVHQLCILTGKFPVEQSCFPRSDFDKIFFDKEIQIGTPCDLISRRPDILAAEARLQEAGINISVARKEFLPVFNITGAFGYESIPLNTLFNLKGILAAAGAIASESLFTGGRKTATLRLNKAKCKTALLQYQKTILVSFQEVEDSLSTIKSDFMQHKETESQVLKSEHLLELTNSRYQQGENSLLDVINAQKELINLEQIKVQLKSDLLIDNISLYKSLGGGF